MNVPNFALAVLMVVLTGCGTIKNYEQLAQPTGKDLATYIGGTIFKVNRSRDLPNQIGRADLFGGKVFAGYTELRYQGMTDDGRLILRITEVETQSTETTMSRYGQSSGNFSGYSSPGGGVYGNVTVYNAPQGSTQILPPNTTDVAFDATKEKELAVAGIRVLFVEFNQQMVRYRLQIMP
jgi:hypothetical protein